MNSVFTIGIFLCFFLQFLLLMKKKATTSDRILAVWMFVFGIHLFSFYLHWLGFWEIYPHLSGIHHPFPLLHGPFLYLYILCSLQSNQHFDWKNFLHFVPALLFYVYLIPFFFFYTEDQKLMINRGELDDYTNFISFSIFAFIISTTCYAIASYRLLTRYEKISKQNFAYTDSIDLDWLKNFIWGMGITFFCSIVVILLEGGLSVDFGFNTDLIFYVLIIVFIFYLGLSGIRHRNLFSDDLSTNHQIVESKSSGEYEKSGLKPEDALEYHQRLLQLMVTTKPYLEPKLTLSSLASELDISVNHLSQVINQYEGKNFFDFVNTYRVEEFKQSVINPKNQNYSILAIALDSGFNSKSSFNQVFKKFTGKTPSQYMSTLEEKQCVID